MAGDAKGQQPITPTPPSLLGLKSDCKASFVLPWPPFKDASCIHMSLWEWLRPSAPPGTASREEGVPQGSSLLVTEPLNTQPETPPFQIPALRAVRPYRPKTLAKIPFSSPSQPAIFTGRQRTIYIHQGLAGEVMAGHSSPSARHLAGHRSISYRRGQAVVVGPAGDSGDTGCTSRVNSSSLLHTHLCKCSSCRGQEVREIRHYFGISLGSAQETSAATCSSSPGGRATTCWFSETWDG